jgi:hypothetical protein
MDEVMIVETAVHALLTGLREALTIWLGLVTLAVVACVLLSAPARRGRPKRSPRQRAVAATPSPHRVRPDWTVMNSDTAVLKVIDTSRDGHATELRRYAEEVTVAATRAAEAAGRWRSEWLSVQSATDAAWQAYEAADEAARRAFRAAAFPTPREPLTPGELAARQRYLHRTAREAYQRGELSLGQLNDALSGRNGWDPRLHPFEQQLIMRRIGLERRLQAYRTVSAMERSAWEAAEVAQTAKQSLRREAYSAQVRARQAIRTVAKAPAAAQLYLPAAPALGTH